MTDQHAPQRPRLRRHRRARERGQSLVIFTLIAVVLFGVVGMAVDGGFGFFVSDRLERGAMAGALAGVPNMPNYNTAPNDATSSALGGAKLNGWTPGGATNVSIAVAQVWDPSTGTYYRNRLAVTVAADVPTFFMKLLGFGAHRESRTAVAEYLRPITFGQPGSQIGSDLASLGTANNFYFMRSEGWGTDRGQGDAYGPNPNDWGGSRFSTPNTDVHALSADQQTEATTQPSNVTLPARGGASYQIFVPAGATGTVQVYNPLFAPDGASTAGNAAGYNFHEDDGDFPTTGSGCGHGNAVSTAPCTGPTDVRQWPVMSYTLYKSPNPFDHTADVWLTNTTVQSIDASIGPAAGTYTIPKNLPATTTYPLTGLAAMYHSWMDVTTVPTGPQYSTLATVTQSNPGSPTHVLSGGSSSGTGVTYRLRADQLDNLLGDAAANGNGQALSSQAHKGYSVRVNGCSTCTVTALDDVTLYTPVKGGGFQMPLVSIPPEYAGHTFSLYVFDPGDVTCNSNGCSNTVSVLRPNGGSNLTTATTTDGVFNGQSGEQGTYSQAVAGPGAASIQTLNQSASPSNIYNGKWIRFDISVPNNYDTADVTPGSPSTWFWYLSYSTSQPASDTLTANLGFTGAPVHLVSG